MKSRMINLIFGTLLFLLPMLAGSVTPLSGEEYPKKIIVGVTYSYFSPVEEIAGLYQTLYGQKIELVEGTAEELMAVVRKGNPFHFIVGIDEERGEELKMEGGVKELYYSSDGSIYLVAREGSGLLPEDMGLSVVSEEGVKKLGYADPKVSRYGQAWQETLKEALLPEDTEKKFITYANLSALRSALTKGAVELAVLAPSQRGKEDFWKIPGWMHGGLRQYVVVFNKKGTELFSAFIRSLTARKAIVKYGYEIDPLLQEGGSERREEMEVENF